MYILTYIHGILLRKYSNLIIRSIKYCKTIQILIAPGAYSLNGSYIDIAITTANSADAADIGYCRSDCFPLTLNAVV